MNFSNGNPEEDMSMEDILSSIRKYVSEESEKTKDKPQSEVNNDEIRDHVINLTASHMLSETELSETPKIHRDESATYDERSSLSTSVVDASESENEQAKQRKPGPFAQLTNALNSYGKNKAEKPKDSKKSITVDELFTAIAEKTIQNWIDKNMSNLVEEIVTREIEKMKSE